MSTNPNLLLLSLVVFLIAYLDWLVYGLKGDTMLKRSPWVILWVDVEVLLGVVLGFGLYEAYSSKSVVNMVCIAVASIIGASIGVGTSGLIRWGKHDNGKQD